jgi:hypothetical protein
MVPAEGMLVPARFVTYYYHHPLVSHPTKTNVYTALQNENSVSCLTIIVNKTTDNALRQEKPQTALLVSWYFKELQ